MTEADHLDFHLIARTVGRDTPPLDGAVATADVTEEEDGWHIRVSIPEGAGEAVAAILDAPDDPPAVIDAPPVVMPASRYELVDATTLPDMECAHWKVSIVPAGDGAMYEMGAPSWLSEDAARAACAIVALMRLAARDACADDTE